MGVDSGTFADVFLAQRFNLLFLPDDDSDFADDS